MALHTSIALVRSLSFSHALIKAVYVITFGSTCCSRMALNTSTAVVASLPFLYALINVFVCDHIGMHLPPLHGPEHMNCICKIIALFTCTDESAGSAAWPDIQAASYLAG